MKLYPIVAKQLIKEGKMKVFPPEKPQIVEKMPRLEEKY